MSAMDPAATAVSHEQQIRKTVADWTAAVQSGDVNRVMSLYSEDVVAFDAIGALQFKGAAAYREHWKNCLSACPGDGFFEVHQLQVHVDDGLAISHYLSRCGGRDGDGAEFACWMRVTTCYRREQGEWLIFHEHFSAPFDPVGNRALTDLAP